MKTLSRLTLLLALLASVAIQAATGTVGASVTDAVSVSLSGNSWRAARWTVTTAGTAKLTTEYTTDGVNWLAAAYSVRVDQVTANPSVASWQNTTAVAGTFDTPISSNTIAFRVRCGTTGTSTVIQLSSGKEYNPGVPVTAVLYDVTSGVNSALDTGTLDTSGWHASTIDWVTSGATATAIHLWQVDGSGATTGTRLSQSVTTPWTAHLGDVGANASFSSGGTSQISVGNLPIRIRADASAVAAQTTRIRIEVRR